MALLAPRRGRIKSDMLSEIEGMSANTWLELDGTNLSALDAPDTGSDGAGSRDPGGLWSYSSGFFHPGKFQFYAWGGGHNDYAGNEVYRLNLNPYSAAFGEWIQLTDPYQWTTSTNTGGVDEIGGQPVVRHTYAYLTHYNNNLVSMGGGALFHDGATGSSDIWFMDLTTGTWDKQTATTPGGDSQNAHSYTDSTNRIWYLRPGTGQQLQEYDPEGDTITAYATSTWDHASNSMSAFRETATAKELWTIANGTMQTWTCGDNSAPSTVSQTNAPFTGSHKSHGFVYVPSVDRFIAHDGGQTAYTLNPNGTWTDQSPTGDTPESEDANFGTYKRFFYHARLNRCFVVQKTNQNVFCYRPPASY